MSQKDPSTPLSLEMLLLCGSDVDLSVGLSVRIRLRQRTEEQRDRQSNI